MSQRHFVSFAWSTLSQGRPELETCVICGSDFRFGFKAISEHGHRLYSVCVIHVSVCFNQQTGEPLNNDEVEKKAYSELANLISQDEENDRAFMENLKDKRLGG